VLPPCCHLLDVFQHIPWWCYRLQLHSLRFLFVKLQFLVGGFLEWRGCGYCLKQGNVHNVYFQNSVTILTFPACEPHFQQIASSKQPATCFEMSGTAEFKVSVSFYYSLQEVLLTLCKKYTASQKKCTRWLSVWGYQVETSLWLQFLPIVLCLVSNIAQPFTPSEYQTCRYRLRLWLPPFSVLFWDLI